MLRSLQHRFGMVRAIAAFCLAVILASTSQPAIALTADEATELWQGSAHALQEVNCSSCHQPEETGEFVAQPGLETCQSCHEGSTETFLLGKHGIRTLEGASPLTPAMALLPMHADAMDKQMNCSTCHDAHESNTRKASVDACLTCHSDRHSLNYVNSKHAGLLVGNEALPRPTGGEVTCATCHLPREGRGESLRVNHNNTYTLKPRDRMVSEVCMTCHGMEFAYTNMFDDEVVEANFARASELENESLVMARRERDRREARRKPS
ncbi:MAG: hypothetical protein AAFX40_14255 [Cyanobacteria bacterium J06639_1]